MSLFYVGRGKKLPIITPCCSGYNVAKLIAGQKGAIKNLAGLIEQLAKLMKNLKVQARQYDTSILISMTAALSEVHTTATGE